MRIRALLLVVLSIGVRTVAAQDATPALTDRDASAELAKIVATTKAHGLPIDPILERVHYAINVAHASPAATVAVARAIAGRLEIARAALAPRDNPADVAAAQVALSYNVPRDVVTAIRKASPEPTITVPLGALVQLVTSGVSVTRASDIVTSFLKRGVPGQTLASFSNDVNSDIRLGGRPDDALNVRIRGLTAALAPLGQAGLGDQAFTTGASAGPPKKP